MIKRISKTSWYALLLGLVFALEITNFMELQVFVVRLMSIPLCGMTRKSNKKCCVVALLL